MTTPPKEYCMIPLTKGQFALVDEEDYPLVAKFKWQAQWNHHTKGFYAQTTQRDATGKWVTFKMSRFLLALKRGDPRQAEHANRDTLDNRRSCNLRVATHSENQGNAKRSAANTSGYKGVCLQNGKWKAQIQVNRKHMHLGYFKTPEDAYVAYCRAALEHRGEFARFL